MNNPYLYPEQAPWTPEHTDAHPNRHSDDDAPNSRTWYDCEEEFMDALYGVIQ